MLRASERGCGAFHAPDCAEAMRFQFRGEDEVVLVQALDLLGL